MRQFERRGTEAPMEFEYERERKDLGPWSSQTFATASMKANSGGNGSRPILQYTPAGSQDFSSRRSYIPFSAPSVPSPMPSSSSYWNPPGSFSPQKASKNGAQMEIHDVTMSSIDDDDDDTPSPTKSGAERPVRHRQSLDKIGGKIMQALKGSPSSPRGGRGKGKKGTRDEDEWLPEDGDIVPFHRSPKKPQRRRKYSTHSSDGGDESDDRHAVSAPNFYNVHLPSPTPPPGHASNELSGYLTFSFKLISLLTALYLGFSFVMTVKQDVDARVLEYSSELLHEIALCSQLYLTNKCHPDTRVPVVEQVCQDWERCMNKDPKVIGRVRVWAETLGEMFNSFVEPIAWKTLAFTVITLFSITFAAWGMFRLFGSWQHHHAAPPPPSHTPILHGPPFPSMLQPPSSMTPRRSPRLAIDAVQGGQQQQQPEEWASRAWSRDPPQTRTTRTTSKRG
ncbi:hypothetical protein FRB98_005945 [Tulasnella sp. 332]|nr:hypothetical protein FRB98_005945 [Tulasnella sp. 332]